MTTSKRCAIIHTFVKPVWVWIFKEYFFSPHDSRHVVIFMSISGGFIYGSDIYERT